MEKTIEIGGKTISYELQRKRIKNLNLRIRPDGTVYVSVPVGVLNAAVESFILKNGQRILDAMERAEQNRRNAPFPEEFQTGDRVLILGEEKMLRVETSEKGGVRIEGPVLILSVRDPGNTEEKKKTFETWKRREVLRILTDACHAVYPSFAPLGVSFPVIRVRKMVSRWGSCQPKNGILTFNSALLAADPDCIAYVVLHEFVHFLHPDHSPAFYRAVARQMPDWKERKERLNRIALFR